MSSWQVVKYSANLLAFGLLLGTSGMALAQKPSSDCIRASKTIEQKLSCINGLTFDEQHNSTLPSGVRHFEIQFTQPVDHANPKAGTFSQRLVLLHRDEAEPMVLQTSGYSISRVLPTRLSALFKTNQLQVEHRYFANSTPQSLDWSKLDIKQSADDFHAITVAFKEIYPARWVNTGASKGGMTSVYHRFYYPEDLNGTVADVAPLSFSTSDQRYVDFVNNVGGEPYRTCRDNFKKMQVKLLENKEDIISNLKDEFNQLGGKAVAFEHMVTESIFYFWQYGTPDSSSNGCQALPHAKSAQDIFNFVDAAIVSIHDYSDEKLSHYMAYYYQAATQLGNPGNVTSHLVQLLDFDFIVDQYTPKNVNYTYSNRLMRDVSKWVRTQADDVMFIYGEFDPWTAGEFPLSTAGKAVSKYYVPKGNHGSKFVNLTDADYSRAVSTLATWFAKAPAVSRFDILNEQEDKRDVLLQVPGSRQRIHSTQYRWLEDAELQDFRGLRL